MICILEYKFDKIKYMWFICVCMFGCFIYEERWHASLLSEPGPVGVGQGSAAFPIQRGIWPDFPPNKMFPEPQKLFDVTAFKLYKYIV